MIYSNARTINPCSTIIIYCDIAKRLVSKVSVETTPRRVSKVYRKLEDNVSRFRRLAKRPFTLSEKILLGHIHDMRSVSEHGIQSGKDYVLLTPDRVALQDVTGQMTILEFMQSGLKRVRLPTTVPCDHLIQAKIGSAPDTKSALQENSETYKFLESTCRKYGILETWCKYYTSSRP